MNQHFLPLLVGIALVPAGCTMAPKYSRPAAPIAVEWPADEASRSGKPEAAPAKDSPAMQPQVPDIAWHEFFADDKLRQLIRTALQNNRDLRIAVLNVERARAYYGISRAELLPTVDASAGGSRSRVPADLSSSGHRQTVEKYNVDLGVFSWEADFFGRIRSLKDRALQEFLATDQAGRSAQILLVSSLANAWLTLAADRENMALAETTLAAQQGSYDLIKRRFDLGLAPELDLYRARTQVETARGDLARFKQLVAQDQNTLNFLVGTPAPAELLPAGLDDVSPTREIVAGMPSDVLLRRPDVLQAENMLRAAYADIGAARAAFFPRISLTATLGTASSDLSGLFKSGSGTWSYAPQLVMPIFDTRTWQALKVTQVQRKIAVTQYERAIQNAFREVADALAVRGTMDEQLLAQTDLVHAVSETYRLSNFRYEKGIDAYLGVLDAQRSLYAAQRGLVSLRLVKLANDVRLYSVLGGGWKAEPPESQSGMFSAQGK